MIDTQRLHLLDQLFPSFVTVVAQLHEAGIPWALSGSACFFVHGNARQPGDLDLFVRDEDHDRIDQLFGIASVPYRSAIETVRNSHPLGDYDIQLTSHLVLTVAGKTYPLSLTPLQIAHRQAVQYEDQDIWLLAPEDVILAKALLQRDDSFGKFDVQDIKDFLKHHPTVDRGYIALRIQELDAEERVGGLLRGLAVLE